MVDEKVTAAIGTAIPIPVFGTLLGSTIGWIVGKLFGWIAELANDNIFTPKPLKFTLAKRQDDYLESLGIVKKSSKWQPKLFSVDFIGHGGHYRVWCYWKIQA